MQINQRALAYNAEAYIHVSNAVLFFTVGALTAIGAWHFAMIWLLLILPLAWHYSRSRMSVYMLMFGYFISGAYYFPHVFKVFFHGSHEWGVVIWLLHGLLLALPYALLRRYGAYGLLAALFVTILPPWGMIGWLSPLLAAGALFPGFGIAGYGVCMLVFFIIAHSASGSKGRWSLLMALLLISIYCNATAPAFINNRFPVWFGQNTYLGNYPQDAVEGFQRQVQLMRQVDAALRDGARLILLPEGIVNQWVPASEFWWKKEIDLARIKKATLLIGATLYQGRGRWIDALVVRGSDTELVKARMPAPIGMWNPFVNHAFEADMIGSGVIRVQGRAVAISICYEDALVYPMALSFLLNRPTAILSSANNWFGAGTDEPSMQNLSIGLQARLYGVPLIRALNLPTGY